MRRVPLVRVLATAAVIVVALAPSAAAHIEPDPAEAQAGSELSVGFTVEHGCDGSPTVQLDMRVPDGVKNPVAVPPPGWTGGVDGDVVTFEGGPQPDDQPLTFSVRLVLPGTPDTTIYFPFVQRCEVGEIRWIDVPTDGSGVELDEPAPAMRLFGPVATAPPAPSPTASPTVPAVPTATAAPTSPTPVSVTPTAAPTAAPSPIPVATATTASQNTDSADGGSSGTLIALAAGAMAVVGGLGAVVFLRSRRRG